VIRYEEGLPRNQRINTVQQGLFVGTLASSRLHKSAVKRNRMRRRCKEALRRYVKDLGSVPTMQLLLMPRSSSLTCDFAEIENDVRAFLSYVS